MDKPLDIRQLSACCGKRLDWKDMGPCASWFASCPACGGRFWADRNKEPMRRLLWTERSLLARIAELEAQLPRWRVMAEEPPKHARVLVWYRHLPGLVCCGFPSDLGAFDQWMPTPPLPQTVSPGADAPKGE